MNQDQASSPEGSPGAVLRAARESAGMSVEQVAEKLHLLHSIVQGLEKDCYDRIRSETFVKGYMRNYARLLGISGDDLVGRYNAAHPAGRSEPRARRGRDSR